MLHSSRLILFYLLASVNKIRTFSCRVSKALQFSPINIHYLAPQRNMKCDLLDMGCSIHSHKKKILPTFL